MTRSNTLLLVCFLVGTCQGQTTLTWDGAAGNGLWGGNNWVEGGYANQADLIFGELDTSSSNITTSLFGGGTTSPNERSPLSITVTRQSGSLSITPGSGNDAHLLRMRSGGISVGDAQQPPNSPGSQLFIETNTRLRVGQTWRVPQGSGELVVQDGGSGPKILDLNGNELTINGPGNTTILTDIVDCDASNPGCGVGSIVKRGEGTLQLDGNNSFTGGMTVHEGEVLFGTTTASFGGNVDVNGAILRFSASSTLTNNMTFNNNFGGEDVPNFVNVFSGQTVDFQGTVSGQQWAKRGGGTLIVNGARSSGGDTGIEAGTLILNGPSSSPANLLIRGGTLEAGGSSVGTGDVRFEESGGTFRIWSNGAINTDAVFSSNGTIETDGVTAFFHGSTSGSGTFTKTGSGILELLGSSSHMGALNIADGTLRANQSTIGSGPINLVGGNLAINSPSTLTQHIDFASATGINVGGETTFLSGTRSGSGAITKSGTATLVLTGPTSNHTGGIVINQGGVGGDQLGSGPITFNGTDSALGPTTNFSAPLVFNTEGIVDVGTGNITHSGSRQGNGTFVKQGSGGLILSGPASDHDGQLHIRSGYVQAQSGQALGGARINFLGAPELRIFGDFSNDMVFNATSVVDTGSGFVTHSGQRLGTGRFIKAGSGTLQLTSTSDHTGAVEIRDGVLKVDNDSQLGTGTVIFRDSGILSVSDDISNAIFSINSGVIDVEGNDVVISGSINGSGDFTKLGGGRLTLTGTNNHLGAITVEAGELVVGNAISDTFVQDSGTLSGAGDVQGNVVNAGGLLKGQLSIQGNVTNQGGRFAPGNSFGITVIDGDLTLDTGSVLEIEVGGTTAAGVDFDQVQVGGNVTLGGNIEFPISFTPQVGDQVTFLTASSVLDTVDGFVSPGLPAGINAQVVYNPTSVQLAFVAPGNILFVDNRVDPNWHDVASWNLPRIPNSGDEVDILNQNINGDSQVLEVRDANAETNSLTVQDPMNPITVNITGARQLFANSGDVFVGQNGQISLGDQQGMSGGLVTAADQSVFVQGGGVLSGNGSVQSDVVVADGSIQVASNQLLYIDEQLSLAPASIVNIELDAIHGRIELGADPVIDGTLEVTLANGFSPNLGDVFNAIQVVNAQDMTPVKLDEFEMENLPILPMGLRLRSHYSLGTLELIVEYTSDLNGDELVNLADINALVAAVASSSDDLLFDLNGDGNVNSQDVTSWLQLAGEVNLGPGISYLAGDSNLDGTVDGNDFLAWNDNKFVTHSVSGWNLADFNADGVTDGADFVIWNGNKFQSASDAVALPEPAGHLLILLTSAFLFQAIKEATH